MGQRRIGRAAVVFLAALSAMSVAGEIGCGTRPGDAPPAPPPPAATEPRVASISPAGTDLVVGMGAADHLVAVSNYDDPTLPQIKGKPRVGDYATIDWEKLATASPQVLVVQYGKDRVPADLRDRCDQRHIALVNIHIDVLDDVYAAAAQVGDAIHEPAKAATAVENLKSRLAAVRARVAGRPPVRTLLVCNEGGGSLGIVGKGTFLDDLLTIAGGTNVAGDRTGYKSIDREALLAAAPDAVIQLLPDASPQVLDQAAKFWATVPGLPAVRDHRVYVFSESYVLKPGLRLGDVAEAMASKLRPDAFPASGPSAAPASATPASVVPATRASP